MFVFCLLRVKISRLVCMLCVRLQMLRGEANNIRVQRTANPVVCRRALSFDVLFPTRNELGRQFTGYVAECCPVFESL